MIKSKDKNSNKSLPFVSRFRGEVICSRNSRELINCFPSGTVHGEMDTLVGSQVPIVTFVEVLGLKKWLAQSHHFILFS